VTQTSRTGLGFKLSPAILKSIRFHLVSVIRHRLWSEEDLEKTDPDFFRLYKEIVSNVDNGAPHRYLTIGENAPFKKLTNAPEFITRDNLESWKVAALDEVMYLRRENAYVGIVSGFYSKLPFDVFHQYMEVDNLSAILSGEL
jgi:hypothetical protein